MNDSLRTRVSVVRFAAVIVTISACATSRPPATSSSSAVPTSAKSKDTTRLFHFHVDFWANLNQVLLHEALVPRPGFDGPKSLKNQHVVQLDTLAPDEAARFREGFAYYDGHFTTRNLFDGFIDTLPTFFAAGSAPTPPTSKAIDEDWRRALLATAPIYRAHFWPAHERKGWAYVAGMRPLVVAHEAWFAERLVAVYGLPLPTAPIDVEITPVVPPFGGFTLGEPPYTPPNEALITLSSEDPSYAGDAGIEMLFHEVSHVLVGRVEKGLADAAKRQGRKLDPRFWHDVVFYTAGHLTKERLGPGYVPYAERPSSQLFQPGDERLLALERSWQPYLDGQSTMAAAIDALAASFPPEK